MLGFRIHLAIIWTVLLIYTAIVIADHGWGLLPIFFGDMLKMEWPGQFNLDFLGFLTLSALWLTWRHHFTPGAFVLGLCGLFGGIGFLAPYLMWASFDAEGDIKTLFLGKQRAAAS